MDDQGKRVVNAFCSAPELMEDDMFYRLVQPEIEGWTPDLTDDQYLESSRGREFSFDGIEL